jgi:hypothetical protein
LVSPTFASAGVRATAPSSSATIAFDFPTGRELPAAAPRTERLVGGGGEVAAMNQEASPAVEASVQVGRHHHVVAVTVAGHAARVGSGVERPRIRLADPVALPRREGELHEGFADHVVADVDGINAARTDLRRSAPGGVGVADLHPGPRQPVGQGVHLTRSPHP